MIFLPQIHPGVDIHSKKIHGLPQFGKNPWTTFETSDLEFESQNSKLQVQIWTAWLSKYFSRAKGSKFGLLVAPNSKVLRSPNAVINFKFGQLVGFDPLTNLANTGPKDTQIFPKFRKTLVYTDCWRPLVFSISGFTALVYTAYFSRCTTP